MIAKTTQQRDSQPRRSAVSHAVKAHIQSRRNQYLAAAVVSGALALPQQAPAQQAPDQGLIIEEITVTATKRAESMQDVPISIVALNSDTLREQAITSFEDYALALPTVAFKSFGYPGSATMIMRGAADGGDGNASGSSPGVCLYMDEQPVTAIAANLDVHIYDVNRIEALAGPQGTLFGASCQSGSLRIITNEADPTEFSGGIDVGGFGTDGGDSSYSVEGYVNMPLSDNAALRLVGWSIHEGGWIDNIPGGTRSYVLANTGQTATFTNDAMAADDINELDKTGARAALGIDLNDNWTLTAGILYQDLETEGVWEHDKFNFSQDHVIQRWQEDSSNDEFTQYSLVLEGEFGNHSLVYAGSFLDREANYVSDYSAYGDYITWVDFYSCHWGYYTPPGTPECTSLNEFATRDNEYERSTHELRLLSLGDGNLHYTVGAFFQQNEHKYLQQWIQPGMAPIVAVPGYPRPDVWFRTDQIRELDQVAVFGELTFDFTDTLSGTIGARWFDEEASLNGVVGWGPYAFEGTGNFPPGDPTWLDTFVGLTDSTSDTIFKVNLTWNVSDDAMLYVTWSEGYRPGGINRDPALAAAGAQTWVPDFLTNYEIGWKSTLAGGRVRLNGAAYFMDWDDIQYTVYNGQLSFCCGSTYNLSTAEIKGLEADITILASDAFTLTAAVSFNDAETTGDFVLPNGLLSVPSGTPLPNVPDFKGSFVARYDFNIGEMGAYAQISYSYTGSSISEITQPDTRARYSFDQGVWPQDSYGIANLRAGIDRESWGVDVFVDNLTDEVAEYYVHPRPYAPSTVTNRPMSYGAKVWMRF